MKNLLSSLSRVFVRFRYPVSLPEDVAIDLGLNLSNRLTFDEFISRLTDPLYTPTKLTRFMLREQAEIVFSRALRKERFARDSLFSYHFNGGWMEFILQFDLESRLRRIYICHKDLKQKYEIPIASTQMLAL